MNLKNFYLNLSNKNKNLIPQILTVLLLVLVIVYFAINAQNNINIQDLKKKEKILKDLEIEIANKKNIISKEAFDKEVIIFRKNIDQFKIEQQQIIKDFNDYKKKEIDKVFQTISPIINSYMEKNSVKILFDAKNIFMARNDLNLTNDILEAINKEAK